MPRCKNPVNQRYIVCLEECRREHTQSSSRYKTFTKAIAGIAGSVEGFGCCQDTVAAHGVGPYMIAVLTAKLEGGAPIQGPKRRVPKAPAAANVMKARKTQAKVRPSLGNEENFSDDIAAMLASGVYDMSDEDDEIPLVASRARSSTTKPAAPKAAPKPRAPPKAPPVASGSSLGGLPVVQDAPRQRYAPAESFPRFDPIVFAPGTYSIQLILDSREMATGKNRDQLHHGLLGKGVSVDRRGLALGDVCWVAKRKIPGTSQVDECVLDFIIERKRLDDLCGSIKDGRFHDQKFRLTNSAITNVYYLVEDYKTAKYHGFFDPQIATALSSTQVVDGFFVKQTHDAADTVSFLEVVHQTIVEFYHGKPLHIIPPHAAKRQTFLSLQKHLRATEPARSYLTSYDTFQDLNSKLRGMTLTECWARMLLCITGLSPEKVATVIAAYATPRDLWEAFRLAEQQQERLFVAPLEEEEEEAGRGAPQKKGRGAKKPAAAAPLAQHLLSTLPGSGRRHVGNAFSARVYDVMMAHEYEA